MEMPSVTILAVGAMVVSIAAAMLWFVSRRALRVSSTSQELLEMFESDATAPRRTALRLGSEALAPSPGARFHLSRAPMQISRTAPVQPLRHRWAQAPAPTQ